jgi:hypothetical protein
LQGEQKGRDNRRLNRNGVAETGRTERERQLQREQKVTGSSKENRK